MVKLSALLEKRFKKSHSEKIEVMAQKSSEGHLNSFTGLFEVRPLKEDEFNKLQTLLTDYEYEDSNPEGCLQDLNSLASLSSEIKTIHHQSVILHGERIKKAKEILKKYKDGAFSAWLMLAYGNRQTPYNFLVYYEFYSKTPLHLRPALEKMPRQAVYVLASRQGDEDKKQEIINNYHGETKNAVLAIIRQTFPLEFTDGRRKPAIETAITFLDRAYNILKDYAPDSKLTEEKIFKMKDLLEKFAIIKNKITEN